MTKEKNRELSLDWWNSLTFEHKFTFMVKYKEHIEGYPDRTIDSFTENEINFIYTMEHFCIIKTLSNIKK